MEEAQIVSALNKTFGFTSFRPHQKEIVQSILEGKDVFAIMPTGGGKSLCYQLPALLMDGVCVVVSPLLSLMKDQVDAARELGIRAAALNSTSSTSDYITISKAIALNELDLLYISPERYNAARFVSWLRQGKVAFFAIDEAHCISQWGHHFRMDYLGLANIVTDFPGVPIAAFTATATNEVANDISQQLHLRQPFYVRASFDRPNLFYQIEYKEDLRKQLLNFLKEMSDESGIIYRSSRKKVEETAEMLQEKGYKARAYHAGMTDSERIEVQEQFVNDDVRIIVATIAFGMGIDKSNVRFVVHADLPKDIEGYYQETGRAGRDGTAARCLLLYSVQDIMLLRSFAEDCEDPIVREASEKRLNEMIAFAESDGCRRKSILKYFGETYPKDNCGCCDFCTDGIQREDVTIDSQKALSAMQRTGNRFGVAHLIDVLMGADTEKIRYYGHNKLPTWGVGKNRDPRFWKTLINSLIMKGAAAMDTNERFPVPKVTEFGWEVMRGKHKIELIRFPALSKKKKKGETSKKSGLDGKDVSASDRKLFDMLRLKRAELARERSVPPYVVFTDKSLWDMTYIKPNNRDEFNLVNGVGEQKMQIYADIFLAVIQEWSEQLHN